MSPAQFVTFATPLPDHLCLLNDSGQIIAANPAAAHFFGVPVEVLVGKNLPELSTDSETKVQQVLRTWSRSREATPGPLTLRTANQQITPCNCFGSLIQPKSDNAPALILLRIENREQFTKSFTALNEKITLLQNEIKKHKQTGAALAQRNAEFEAMFNSIPDAVLFVDLERRIIMNNPAARAMFGYNSEELIGNTTEMLYADKEEFRNQGASRYREGPDAANDAYEIQYKRKNGTHFWTESLGTQVTNKNGEIIGFIGLIREITERRKINKELEQHRNHLESMVAERTTALEAANKELEAFSYSVSHDLIAPLRSIDGFSQALLEDYGEQLDASGKDYLQRVHNSTLHMGQLINDLLSLSKVTRGELKRELIDLSAEAHIIIKKFQESDPQRDVSISIAPDMQCIADKRLLSIALVNLFGNAWKYTSNTTKAKIIFGATQKGEKTTYYIEDNGVGFNMKYADKLFEAFQRLHQSNEFEGTGIGLATVSRILQRHGGKIWAKAEVDKGATFYFSLNSKPTINLEK